MTGNGSGSRLPVTAKALRAAAFAAAALALGACSGGGGSAPDPTSPPIEPPAEPAPEPSAVWPGDILARADSLLFSSHRSRYVLAGGGAELRDVVVEMVDCAGTRCVAGDGTAVTVADLATPAAVGSVESEAGSRGGFDSVTVRYAFEATEHDPGVTVTASPAMVSYGFWGAHGFAALEIGSGTLAGTVGGTTVAGDFTQARAYAVGAVSGSNPAGPGGAVWRGIAEASPTDGFARLTGTATVRIADLSRPRVSVAVDVPGHAIGAPGWADMALANGGFATGTAGRDYLAGSLHGPDHEEAWGVFDTDGYIGAFGARRGP